MIGKFEELVLLALVRSGPKSTPTDIFEVMASKLEVLPKFGAVFTCLNRMEQKKWVKIDMEGDKLGGRQRKKFTVTGEGRKALTEALQATHDLGGIGALPALMENANAN